MALQKLQLSLQFGDIPYAARHRAALPRHAVARAIRHALTDDAEITVRIVGEEEGRQLNLSYRKKDYATNVLTFDYMQSPVVMADLVLYQFIKNEVNNEVVKYTNIMMAIHSTARPV